MTGSLWCYLAVLVCIFSGYETLPVQQEEPGCGYQSCPAGLPGKLNVHLVAHTHDDVGWLKTVDQYYYGGRNNIQKAGVQYILDSVICELLQDPSKRFIYVETSFLWKWWQEQDETMRANVRGLVNSGRLEMIGGGWSMNDEAVTHYQSTIDQLTWGFRILNDTLGSCAAPRVGWQIDPFGHSREMASILAQFGMDGLFFGRLDEQDKVQRLQDKTMEMVWQASPDNLGSSSDLFTHAMYNFYWSPPGFCFDIMCSDDPMVDDLHSPEYNIPGRVQEFIEFVRGQAAGYKTKNLIVTMGGDFHYQDANVWFKNLDKLIKYTNNLQANGSDVNVFYSTPSCYLKAVNDADETWPTKQDDFFPYGSEEHSYWTGYYTSKPTMKFFERLGNNFLQVSKQLTALAAMSADESRGVTELREAMGVMQHHDAITGTMKDHVAQDYYRILSEAVHAAGQDAQTAINKLINKDASLPVLVTSCLQLNSSVCATSEGGDNFVVTVYNPLSTPVSHYVRLPVTHCCYSVTDPAGNELPTQMVALPDWVTSLPGRESPAVSELVFRAVDLPPIGFRSYHVARLESTAGAGAHQPTKVARADSISNQLVTLTLGADGSTQTVAMNGVEMPLRQTFGYYNGYYEQGVRSSGAYIFRPNGTETIDIPITQAWIVKGDLVQEVHQLFEGGWVAQVVRLYDDEDHVEFEWQVGPIPANDHVGKEVISRYHTDLDTSATFYTDSNGRETMKRVRNHRPTWSLNLTEPVASNFYPVTSKIHIMDEVAGGRRAAILVDRAQSGTSLGDGQVELMVHRRLFHDDGYGVDEPLDERAYGVGVVARGRHYLVVGGSPAAARERFLARRKLLQPWTFLTLAGGVTQLDWATDYYTEFSGLTQSLPDNVHLLTLERWGETSFLVRLEHFLERREDPELSATAVVNLQDLFDQFLIVSAQETTLGGNHLLSDSNANRLRWRAADENKVVRETLTRDIDFTQLTLDPMQIRTFVVEVIPKLN